ncbi:hypothetical protein [Streptomyces sp. NPDC055134]
MSHEPTDPPAPRPRRPASSTPPDLPSTPTCTRTSRPATTPSAPRSARARSFRIETALAALAVLLVLFWRRSLGDVFAWFTAAGGLAALLVHRYADVGGLGPLPNMYEPLWCAKKDLVVISQIVTIVAMATLLVGRGRGRLLARRSASGH